MKSFAATLSFLIFLFTLSNAQVEQRKSVYFALNSCTTLDDLSRIIPLFGTEGKIEIEVFGYTDFLGSEHDNLQLSECRAESVGAYLEAALEDRIVKMEVIGHGEIASIAETNEGDPKNRRVDLRWIVYPPEPEPGLAEVQEEVAEQEMEDVIEIDTASKENIVLEGLQFIPGRHYPLTDSYPVLEKLLATMKKNKTLEIEIQGFICCDYTVKDGYDNDTQEPKLSENRAKFVATYLIQGGIDPKRITYKGYGNTRPKVYPEKSPEDEQMNRRVEIKILKY